MSSPDYILELPISILLTFLMAMFYVSILKPLHGAGFQSLSQTRNSQLYTERKGSLPCQQEPTMSQMNPFNMLISYVFKSFLILRYHIVCRSQWPRGLRLASSNAGMVDSNPIRGMDVCSCLFCLR
jgi:hypothetical protein